MADVGSSAAAGAAVGSVVPGVGNLIGAGVGALGGLLGNLFGGGDRDKANAAQQQALQQWLSIHVPDPAQQQLELQKYQRTGEFSPQLQQTFQQQQSQLNNISVDPATRDAQMSALSQLQTIGSANGLDNQARYANQQSINASNANEAGQRGAILQNFASRGVGGAGAELAAQLQASQGDANQQASAGLQASAAAQQRALAAMTSGASLAGQVHAQDYGQAAAAAQANDTINQFNTANSQKVAGANQAATNAAGLYNNQTDQSIANQNTQTANYQQQYNKQLYQQQFQDEAQKAAGVAGQDTNVANRDTQNAQNTAGMWSGIGQALSTGAGALNQKAPAAGTTPAPSANPIAGGYASMSQADKDSYDKAIGGSTSSSSDSGNYSG